MSNEATAEELAQRLEELARRIEKAWDAAAEGSGEKK